MLVFNELVIIKKQITSLSIKYLYFRIMSKNQPDQRYK